MLTILSEAAPPGCGAKAATLGELLRHGLPVPDGFVVPYGQQSANAEADRAFHSAVRRELERLDDSLVAVRSSAATEDTVTASAAGQYESVLGVRGPHMVCSAIATCRASAAAERVSDYWRHTGGAVPTTAPAMAVLVQSMIGADVAGVMFTPQAAGEPTRIEASWGLGVAVVNGTVTPDVYEVGPGGTAEFAAGTKAIRTDFDTEQGGLVTAPVAPDLRRARTLDDGMSVLLAELGRRIAAIRGGPQDIEWAVADGSVWILQARPVTASVPATPESPRPASATTLTGTPGSHGTITARARVVRGPSDFPSVKPGEIVVCLYTDPAWTPLFTIAAGVVTEAGGALSHAAIVAREYGIPAVLAVAEATTRIANGASITLDGSSGTITIALPD